MAELEWPPGYLIHPLIFFLFLSTSFEYKTDNKIFLKIWNKNIIIHDFNITLFFH